jgi:hypothetical protein
LWPLYRGNRGSNQITATGASIREAIVTAQQRAEIAALDQTKKLPLYVVFSFEHQAFWGPGRYGYVQDLAQAGRYSHADAIDISRNAIAGQWKASMVPPEMPIALADLAAVFALVADLGAVGPA